jgi:hypothetical protein
VPLCQSVNPKRQAAAQWNPAWIAGESLILELCFQTNSTVYGFVTRTRRFALAPVLLSLVPSLHWCCPTLRGVWHSLRLGLKSWKFMHAKEIQHCNTRRKYRAIVPFEVATANVCKIALRVNWDALRSDGVLDCEELQFCFRIGYQLRRLMFLWFTSVCLNRSLRIVLWLLPLHFIWFLLLRFLEFK